VPTLAETGVPDVVAGSWFGLLAPAATPLPIVKKLEAASRRLAGAFVRAFTSRGPRASRGFQGNAACIRFFCGAGKLPRPFR
jgi:hypothetical protein